jgi:hypothetical protein
VRLENTACRGRRGSLPPTRKVAFAPIRSSLRLGRHASASSAPIIGPDNPWRLKHPCSHVLTVPAFLIKKTIHHYYSCLERSWNMNNTRTKSKTLADFALPCPLHSRRFSAITNPRNFGVQCRGLTFLPMAVVANCVTIFSTISQPNFFKLANTCPIHRMPD